MNALSIISIIIGIISGILTIVTFFFAKDIPRVVKSAALFVFTATVLFSALSVIGNRTISTSSDYLNISDEEWKVGYRTAYLGSDITHTLNYAEAGATLFQVDDEGTATFQITHETTEKDTDGWLFMIVTEDKKIIEKKYVPEMVSSTELKTKLRPG